MVSICFSLRVGSLGGDREPARRLYLFRTAKLTLRHFISAKIAKNQGAYYKGPFTRAIFVTIFLILTHAIEWLSHKSIDLNSFAQMV